MSKPNTSEAKQLMFFSEDRHVRGSASPTSSELDLPMSVISGLKWLGLSGQPDHVQSLWRMCLEAVARASSTRYEVIWKKRDTPQHRFSFLLRYSERRTNDTGSLSSGFWPTPSANDDREREMPEAKAIHTTTGTLRYRNAVGTQSQVRTSQAVKYWATPQSRDFRQADKPGSGRMARRKEQGWTIDLNDQAAQWSTPAAQDFKNVTLPPSQAVRDTLPGDLLRNGETAGAYLNPDWVETLMGLPPGWTSLVGPQARDRTSTPMSHRARFRHRMQKRKTASGRSVTRSSGSRSIRW